MHRPSIMLLCVTLVSAQTYPNFDTVQGEQTGLAHFSGSTMALRLQLGIPGTESCATAGYCVVKHAWPCTDYIKNFIWQRDADTVASWSTGSYTDRPHGSFYVSSDLNQIGGNSINPSTTIPNDVVPWCADSTFQPSGEVHIGIAGIGGSTCLLTSTCTPPTTPDLTYITGDPHIRFAHGGYADFRGVNNTYYVLLSAPGVQFAALTTDTEFLLPRPQFVKGSFFTRAAWTLRGKSGCEYGIVTDATGVGFSVVHPNSSLIVDKQHIWQVWEYDAIRVGSKQLTVYVRAHGWEVNVTRKPIYNYVSGPSHWRFDIGMRQLDGTSFAKQYGSVSKTCYPHGIIGQSYDGDNIAVSGKTDDLQVHTRQPGNRNKGNGRRSHRGC
jgi:hypothetical protein